MGTALALNSRVAAVATRFCDLGCILPRMATIDISRLSPEERLELLEQLWDSLSSTPEAVPLTDAQRQELDRRLDEIDRDGPTGIPWDEVMRRIRSRAL